MSKKSIAIVCFSRSLGGLELTSFRLAKSFSQRNISVSLIGLPETPLAERAAREQIPFIAVPVKNKYGSFSALRSLVKEIRNHKIDLLLLMQSKDIFLAAFAKIFSRPLALVYYQQMDTRFMKRDFFHTWAYSKLSHWFTLTTMMKQNVLDSTRVNAEKISVLPLGIDLERFNPALFKKNESRKYFGIPQNKIIIGLLGRLDKGKGQQILLEAVPSIIKKFPETFFIIAGEETAGESGFKKYLLERAQSLKIEQHLQFLPFTEEVPRFLSALDIFVMPSFAETFGLVLIEAMAMGLPVVSTKAGGVPDIVEEGRTGLLVPPGDAGQLSSAILKIVSDKKFAGQLGTEARTKALRRYNFNDCVDALLALMQKL